MPKIKVQLNRLLGNSGHYQIDPIIYEMIIPIKNKWGGYTGSIEIYSKYGTAGAFYPELVKGRTILINDKGGWNLLSVSDKIIKMWVEE